MRRRSAITRLWDWVCVTSSQAAGGGAKMGASKREVPAVPDTRNRPHSPAATGGRRARTRELFHQLRATGDPSCRDELVQLHLPLVKSVVRRFQGLGEPAEDLLQVGTIALLKAIDRFEPDRGWEFSTFARPTISGELKRHFRDRSWAVRPPRGLQERSLRVTRTRDSLGQRLGRAPTATELAEQTGERLEDVLEALEAADAYTATSLDMPAHGDIDVPLHATLGGEDPSLVQADALLALRPDIAALPCRERQILYLRFFEGLTQSEIGRRIGISQMHVSRQLRRSLEFLRRRQTGDPTARF